MENKTFKNYAEICCMYSISSVGTVAFDYAQPKLLRHQEGTN